MFPLGSTVFPGQVVPLHIFEDRYRTLLRLLTDEEASAALPFGHGAFGIVLIDRGHEVGGGDSRAQVGTKVEILQAEEFEDGRWGAVVAGVERINIIDWLDDDPYPQAMVTVRPVADNGGGSLVDVEAALLEVITLTAKDAGVEVPGDLVFSTDPHEHLDQMSALAPLTDFDRQSVLEATTTADQLGLLHERLEDRLVLLRAQLGEK